MRILILSALLVLPTASQAARLEYLTLGPMIHWNFGDYRFIEASWGIEAAYWNVARSSEAGFFNPAPDFRKAGYGLSLGIDFNRQAIRFYTEPQLGWIAYGLSLGPVVEVSLKNGVTALGIHGSGWANALLGLDFRYRYVAGRHDQALGSYGKYLLRISGEAVEE